MPSEAASNPYRRLLLLWLKISLGALSIILLFNFCIDPSYRFLQRVYDKRWVEEYVKDLRISTFGLEHMARYRDVKRQLLDERPSCVVLGSSRAFLLSPRLVSAVRPICPDLINLSVEAFEFDDLLIFSRLASKAGVKKLILSLDPHAFAYNSRDRWLETTLTDYDSYSSELDDAKKLFGITYSVPDRARSTPRLDLLLSWNALRSSLEFTDQIGTRTALRRIIRPFFFSKRIKPIPEFEPLAESKQSVILPDGAIIRAYKGVSADQGQRLKMDRKQFENLENGLARQGFFEVNTEPFKALMRSLKASGIELYFYLEPFERTRLDEWGKSAIPTLRRAERRYVDFASELRIPIFGTFDSFKAGCGFAEFYDLAHAQVSCIEKSFKITWPQTPAPVSVEPDAS